MTFSKTITPVRPTAAPGRSSGLRRKLSLFKTERTTEVTKQNFLTASSNSDKDHHVDSLPPIASETDTEDDESETNFKPLRYRINFGSGHSYTVQF